MQGSVYGNISKLSTAFLVVHNNAWCMVIVMQSRNYKFAGILQIERDYHEVDINLMSLLIELSWINNLDMFSSLGATSHPFYVII